LEEVEAGTGACMAAQPRLDVRTAMAPTDDGGLAPWQKQPSLLTLE